jgi:hypothetical protein
MKFWANSDIPASARGSESSSSSRHQRAAVDEISFVALFARDVRAWVCFLGFAPLFPTVPSERRASKCPPPIFIFRGGAKIGPFAGTEQLLW